MIVRLPPGEVARAALILLAVVLGAYLLWLIREILVVLILAILLATAIEPTVNRLRRGPFSRGAGVLVVYSIIVLAIGLPIFLFAPTILAQAAFLAESVPARIAALRPYAEQIQPSPLQDAITSAIDRLAADLRSPAPPPGEQIVQAGATAATTIFNLVLVFVVAFYWLMERATIKRAVLRLVPPASAKEVNAVWNELEVRLGGYIRGQLTLMLAVGAMAATGFLAIGLPGPLLLAVFAAFAEMIPIVGPFIAFIPAVLVALVTDPAKALLVVGFAVVVQVIEGNVLVPRVMSQAVGISPLTVILGIQAGAILFGLPGALLAVPVAAAIQVILDHLLHREIKEEIENRSA